MTTPKNPATSGALTRLLHGGDSLRRASRSGTGGARALKRWAVRLAAVVIALVVLWQLFLVVVRIATTQMWFDSVHHGGVYQTTVKAQILLFFVFGVLASAVSGLTIVAVRRFRSPLYVSQDDDTFRWMFRKYESRFSKLIVVLAVVVPGVVVGKRAAGSWQTYLLWEHAQSWGSTDPLFHKDLSFYIDVYPFHLLVVSLLSQAVTYGLWIAVIGGYWYGGWRLRRGRQKVIRDFTRLVSLLLGAFLVLTAANYWLARYALTTSGRGPVTGASYTDSNAALPGKYVLVVVALLAAVLLIVNGIRAGQPAPASGAGGQFGRLRTLAGTLAVVAVVSALAGTALPGLVYRFREAPSAGKVDLSEIRDNQRATLAAFGLQGVTPQAYHAAPATDTASLVSQANSTAQMSVLDPNQLSPTFNVEQQLQAYYGFKSTLDTGNYPINGKMQDVALAVRELRAGGIPQSSWVNQHLVYTHGYGVVAAPTDQVDPKTQSPTYLNGGIPPAQDIPVTRPQVYFGQGFSSSSYAIVGQPAGSTQNTEFDHPGSGSSKSAYTTYTGDGGIPIGSTLRRFLFAVQMHDSNILFSSQLTSASKLLTLRDPRSRVAKVAPWLTLDGDVYPAVVDGHIEWIVDGYTTTSNYPYSQSINLGGATSTTLTANGASIAQPNSTINYMQNSVKAVVDAYTGQVTLYEWNQSNQRDPLLKTWEAVYPGLVKPQSDIPAALVPELRYPTDLFNVQRYVLSKYHVTSPTSFYSGSDFWKVPTDPTVAAANTINATAGTASTVASQPARYMSMAIDASGQQYSLSSPMVTLNGQQLAAFVYVNSTPGPGYGKFTVLEFPTGSGSESPAQVQNDIESNTTITESLTLQRGGNSKVVVGDLEAIPVAGRMLYVEPIYTQSNGSSSFPILRHVIALYGNGDPSFENDLASAVRSAIADVTGTP